MTQPVTDGTKIAHLGTWIEMGISGIAGLVVSFILSIEAWRLAKNPLTALSCDISNKISCSKVALTWQAQLLGFPNAFLGILFEAVVLTVTVSSLLGADFPRIFMRLVNAFYTIGLVFALWLFFESYFVIGALCPYCLVITLTTTLVWAGLTRINVSQGNVPAPAFWKDFVAHNTDWILTGLFLALLVALIFIKIVT